MSIERVVEKIKENSLAEAVQLSEELRKMGVPITSIRSGIYNLFQQYKHSDRKRAEQIAEVFGEDYKFKYWLKFG